LSAGNCTACGVAHGTGCTSCSTSTCSTRDCTSVESVMCGSGEYLTGCTADSVGKCVLCESIHGAGCETCSTTACFKRNCVAA
jgi:hypothetical protein